MNKTGKELLSEAIQKHEEIHRLIEIRKETESYWREQIAKEIEALQMTIAKFPEGTPGMMKRHPDCWKCGTPAYEEGCHGIDIQNFRGFQRVFAAIARGQK